jgi:hypothetical protein
MQYDEPAMNESACEPARLAKPYDAPKLRKPFGGGLGTEGRSPNAGRLTFPDGAEFLRDRRIAGRQSRLNTTDASQPVMTAIMAVITP